MATLPELWATLEKSVTVGGMGGHRLQMLLSAHDIRIYGAISEDTTLPGILIEMPTYLKPRDLSRITTRTIEAITTEFPGLPPDRSAMSLQLKDNEFRDLFSIMGEEIIQAIQSSKNTENACGAIVRCVDRWRRFVEKDRRQLSNEEVRGLIGELIVLARCAGKLGSMSAVQAWRGPTGALRDFELPDFSIEVKTYQSDTGASVRINHPEQLDISDTRPVYLAVIGLAQTQSSGMTLPEYVEAVNRLLESDREATEIYYDQLADYGYLLSHASKYNEKYTASRVLLYRVRDGFPHIRAVDVPLGVENLHFSIALRALSPFSEDPDIILGPTTVISEM